MKQRSASIPLRPLTIALAVSVLLLTIAGRVTYLVGPGSLCHAWPFCAPTNPFEWVKLVHVILGAISAVLMLSVLGRTWTEYRSDRIVLPLTTVTAVLFAGQAFVGAMQVVRGFPEHLVVLHTLTAVSLWISLVALIFTAHVRRPEAPELPPMSLGQRLKDFLALGKPLIVALLLVTTFGGLVVGGKAWPSPTLAFWTLLGGALAAGGSSALNQYIDRDLDKHMQRTAKRPLAAGRMAAAEGLAFGLALCLLSYYILAGMVNLTAALLSLTASSSSGA